MRTPLAAALAASLLLCCGTAAADSSFARSFALDVETGVGYDSNPVRMPKDSYYDQRNDVVRNPDEPGTLFFPVTIRSDYRPKEDDENSFVTDMRVNGQWFTDETASNADELYAKISPGYEWVLGGNGSKRDTIHATPFLVYNKELFYDRDTGDDFVVEGTNVSDRYTYTSVGGEFEYERRSGERFEFNVGGRYESRDYEEVSGISEFDQTRYRIDGQVEIEVGKRANLYFDAAYYVYDYDERPSRSLDGRALTANPPREYTYNLLGASWRKRIADAWTLYLDYERRTREDGFVGYHDYDQDTFGLRLLWRSDRWRVRVAPEFWTRDYDNAFAFDLPENPQDGSPNPNLDFDTWEIEARAERGLSGPISLIFEIGYRDEDSADPRYAHVRERVVAGIRWRPWR